MTATAVILSPGDVLGGFQIADVLGIGGMAIVYRARQVSLDREVALKVLSPELAADESFSERFRAEGMHAARLDHPNVVPVYDAGEDQGRLYLAMRLVEGMSLAERLRIRPLTVQETLDILRPIAHGLDGAHAIGLIHRDVKPQNILLTDEGHPYLADFGVAKGVDSAGLTASGGFVGTLNYAAPEQVLGTATSAATDIYALAAVLYHCLTGMVPYPRDTQAGLMFAQVNQAPPRVPVAEAEKFNQVMQRGMAKDPEERFTSAGGLMSAAEEAIGALSAPFGTRRPAFASNPASPTWASGPDRPQEPTRQRPRRSVRRSVILLVAGLAAAVAIAATQIGGRPPDAVAKRAQSPPLAIEYSAPWARAGGAFAAEVLRGPRPGTAAAIQLRYGLASLAAGFLRQSSAIPGGPPPALLARFHRPIPAQSQARRGSPDAVYRWTVSNVLSVTVWVIPTVRGDLAVICSVPVGMTAPMRSCEAMASGVRVTGVARLPVGSDRALATAVSRIVSRDAASRSALAHMFRDTKIKPASVPGRLAAADELAQTQLHRLRVPLRYQSAVSGLASGFGSEAKALTGLSSATKTDNQSAYLIRSRAVREESGDLAGLSVALRRDGLLNSELSALVVPKLPAIPSSTPGNAAGSTAGGSGGSASAAGAGTSTGTAPPSQANSGSSSSGNGTSSGGTGTTGTTSSGGPIH